MRWPEEEVASGCKATRGRGGRERERERARKCEVKRTMLLDQLMLLLVGLLICVFGGEQMTRLFL